MKKLTLLFSIFALTSFGQSATRYKVIQAIQEYVKNNYNDPTSYQNIEYSQLDSAQDYPYTVAQEIADVQEHIDVEHQADSIITAVYAEDPTISKAKKEKQKSDAITDHIKLVNKLASLKQTPQVTYYLVIDKNRTKNKYGALQIITVKYLIDNTFKVLESTYKGD